MCCAWTGTWVTGRPQECRQVGERRLRGGLRLRAVLSQDAEHATHLLQRGPGGLLDGDELPLRLGGEVRDPVGGGLRLHDDHRHVVGDDVVQLASDAAALLEDRAPGPLDLGVLRLLRQLSAREEQPSGEQAEGDDDDDTDGPRLGPWSMTTRKKRAVTTVTTATSRNRATIATPSTVRRSTRKCRHEIKQPSPAEGPGEVPADGLAEKATE